jgi:hypothetical protein
MYSSQVKSSSLSHSDIALLSELLSSLKSLTSAILLLNAHQWRRYNNRVPIDKDLDSLLNKHTIGMP